MSEADRLNKIWKRMIWQFATRLMYMEAPATHDFIESDWRGEYLADKGNKRITISTN
jgi:hypothetical protein